jgi:hypothetical protein
MQRRDRTCFIVAYRGGGMGLRMSSRFTCDGDVANEDLVHAIPVHVHDFVPLSLQFKMIAGHGNAPELQNYKTAEGRESAIRLSG